MAEGAVDVAVVFGLTAAAAGVRTPHKFVAQFCRETRTPTVGFMALDPGDTDIMDQVDEGIELGLQGVKLYPVLAGFSPLDDAVEPFLDLLESGSLSYCGTWAGAPVLSAVCAIRSLCSLTRWLGAIPAYVKSLPTSVTRGSGTRYRCFEATSTSTPMSRAYGRVHSMATSPL